MNTAVFLDRDGVINKSIVREGKPFSPMVFNDFIIKEGVKDAVLKLKNSVHYVIVVTNQPEISRGNLQLIELEKMHNFLKENIELDHIYICPHDNFDNCKCRKPNPGMLIAAASTYNLNLKKSFMVGDRSSDIQAGVAAGTTNFFIRHGYNEPEPDLGCTKVDTLKAAVLLIEKMVAIK